MNADPAVDIVRTFIESRFGKVVTAEQPLIGSIVDSLGVMDLVEFVERTFAVTIPNMELTAENLGSCASIARTVARCRAAATG